MVKNKAQNLKILFLCARNKIRSRTAETIFRNREDVYVKSAGFSSQSPVKVSASLINWADLILVMEYEHSKRAREMFRDIDLPEIGVLDIPDEYQYMDEELIELLEVGLEQYI